MTGFDRDLIGQGFDRGDPGVTEFREEQISTNVKFFGDSPFSIVADTTS